MTWTEWIDRHALLFGLTGRRQPEMLALWAELFSGDGYRPDEALAATDALARDPPAFRDEMLGRMWVLLRKAKFGRRPEPPRPMTSDDCPLCGGTGFASVPTPETVARGSWGTTAVTCSCSLGKWIWANKPVQKGGKLFHQLSLEEYERDHPFWQETVAEHQQQQQRWAAAQGSARQLDDVLGRIVAMARRERA